MPPFLPASSLVWVLALALWNIRLVSAVPSTVVVDDQDTRIQYTPAEQWFHDPSSSGSHNGSYTSTYGASAIFRFTGIGINITTPTAPDQALRMILLNNVSIGTCAPETPELGPPTSFFSKSLDYGEHIVEVRHVDTTPNRILIIDSFRVTVDNDLYPSSQPNLTLKSASFSANQSSDTSSAHVSSGSQAGSSPNIVALIIALPLIFLTLVCPIGTWLWVRRRHQQHSRRESTDTSERPLEPGRGHSRRTISSNLSEFGVEALTIQEPLTAPPTMGPNMAAAVLDSNSRRSSRRRQPATILPSGPAAGYPPDAWHQAVHTPNITVHALDEQPIALPSRSATPLPPVVDLTERRRSRSPNAFLSRLSHNLAAAFRSPTPDSAEIDGATDETSFADSYSTPMTLGVRLNYQPTATASSTLHGSESEDGKGSKLHSSIASHSALTNESAQAPSLSSRASLGHSQGFRRQDSRRQNSRRQRRQRRDPSPIYVPDVPSDFPTPGSAQSGQLSLSSVSSGMVTALTHQTHNE